MVFRFFDIIVTHPQFILLKINNSSEDSRFLYVVYDSPNASLRKRFWKDLAIKEFDIDDAWLIISDFNAVLSADEVSTQGLLALNKSGGFQELIYDQGLIDLGFVGPTFT